MARVCKAAPSLLSEEPLSGADLGRRFSSLLRLLSSSYGPAGGLKLIRNRVGGRALTTSTSSVLLRAASFSEALLRLTAEALLTHSARFGDCGLFAGIFCIGLIENARNLSLRPAQVSRVYKHLLAECTRYLRSGRCACRVEMDFSSTRPLLALARSGTTSKRACMMRPGEEQHITAVVLQAFLQSAPGGSSGRTCFGRTVTVTLEGHPVGDSALFPGLLLDAFGWQDEDLERLGSGPGPYKTVLFSTSLSGDLSEMGEAVLEVQEGVDTDGVVLDQLLKLGEQVVRDGVQLFLCQKVIHPVLQQRLKEGGLVVIERLGVALMEPIAQMTGATMIASIYAPVQARTYGLVGGLSLHRRGSKTLLQLLPSGDPVVSTMLLCHRNETMLDELKVTCQRAEQILRLTLKEPFALLGGGCTETLLSAYVRYMSESKATEAAASLNCSHSEFLLCADAFCRSLQSVARSLEHDDHHCLMDMTYAHCWVTEMDTDTKTSSLISCNCGLVMNRPGLEKTPINTENHSFLPACIEKCDSEPKLLDSFTAKLNALDVAVEMASVVLDVKYVIKDVN